MNLWPRFLIALVIAAMLAGCSFMKPVVAEDAPKGAVQDKADAYLLAIQAENALIQGNLEKAKTLYTKLAEIDPNNPATLFALAQLEAKSGDLDNAVSHARKAYELDPSEIDAAILLARLYSAKGMIDEAIGIYRKIAEAQPDDEEIILMLSGLLIVKKDFEQAHAVIEKFVEYNSNSAMGHYQRARINLVQDKCAEAKPDLEKALELDKQFDKAEIALGFCSESTNDREGAVKHYERALEIYPDNPVLRQHLVRMHLQNNDPDAADRQNEKLKLFQFPEEDVRMNRALILFQQARFAEAVIEFNLVLAAEPGNGFALYYRGVCQSRLNKLQEAMDSYGEIPKDDPLHLDGLIGRGVLLRRMSRFDEAEKELRAAAEIAPKDTYLTRTLALVLADTNRVDEAVVMMNEAIKLSPDDNTLLYALANIYERAGRWKEGITVMEGALGKSPDDADALNFIGYTLLEHDSDPDRAEKLLRKATEVRPTDGYIKDSYGWLLYKKGKKKEALPVLTDALRLVPDEPVVAEHVGDCIRDLGDKAKALEYYRNALDLHPEQKQREELEKKVRELE